METDPYEQTVLDNIVEYGWAGTIIEPDEVGSGFEYTTGLLVGFDHPEIIIFGLPSKTAHDVLWQMFRDIKEGRNFCEEGLYEGLIERFACRVQAVHQTWHREFFGYALWHRRHAGLLRDFAAVQCLWPDKDGRVPGEHGCNSRVMALQPDLSKPKPTDDEPDALSS